MFRSTSFKFDGVSSETYGLMIYFTDDSEIRDLSLGTDVELIEDRLPKQISPIHYGVDMNKPMTFPLTFGSTNYLKDYDVDAILSWLTGHQQYKWLEFIDGDHYIRYKCHLNNVKTLYVNGLPFAFECDVECDGQFGYEPVEIFEYEVNELGISDDFFNRSSYNGYLYPDVEILFNDDCTTLSIVNETDGGREFKINHFDRETINTTSDEIGEITTLGAKIQANSELNESIISWENVEVDTSIHIAEIIQGENIWVALPYNDSTALYSEDNGLTWTPTPLPYSGTWTGCYGDNKFVAICKDNDSDVASVSEDGITWSSTIINLPIIQTWNRVRYMTTAGVMKDQYVAVGGPNSNIVAVSDNGWAWQSYSLPFAQEWRDVIGGDGNIIAIGGNSNVAAITSDCIDWFYLELPKNATWTTGVYNNNIDNPYYALFADTLYDGLREEVALVSTDFETWNIVDFPLGAWSDAIHNNGSYVVIGEKQFAYSLDSSVWTTNTLPRYASSIIVINDGRYICTVNDTNYLLSADASVVEGSFSIDILGEDSDLDSISNVFMHASIADTLGDDSYSTNGEKLLATYTEDEFTGGDFIPITSDLRYGAASNGVMLSATFDPNGVVNINYIADSGHNSVISAPLEIRITFDRNYSVDYGYDNLVANFNNKNKIITTNKDNLNMYEYFNKHFFRLVKGLNKLNMKTDSGSCKVIIKCEFLRKVGGN